MRIVPIRRARPGAALAGASMLVAVLAGLLAGCGDDGGATEVGDGPVQVAAAFYPLAYAAEAVGGDRVQVADLTPPGAEPHDLEITSDQVDRVLDAHLVVVLGDGFQPAVERVADRRRGVTVTVLDRDDHDDDDQEDDDHDHDHGGDPHVWLDPVRMGAIVRAVADGLREVDPDRSELYDAGEAAELARLDRLDADWRAGTADCRSRVLVTAHRAFGHLAARYALEEEALAGIEPTTEPDPRRLGELADLVRRAGVTTVFTETAASRRLADALAAEAGVDTAVLDPLEGLSKDRQRAGDDYHEVMRRNLAAVRAGLGCR